MRVDLIISAGDIKEEKIKGKSVVVIDMLRATSVIVTAINNSCDKVIPVLTVEEALELCRENRSRYILGGERKALKIDGFDCSNSPLEYTKEVVANKTIIMTTSNGTRAIKGSEVADYVFLGALINSNAVAKKLVESGRDVVLVNAGTDGELSIDDFICSGYIIECLKKLTEVSLTDVAVVANYIYKNNEECIGFIEKAAHYKRIKELGLEEDLKYCCQKDIIDMVPEYVNGEIKARE